MYVIVRTHKSHNQLETLNGDFLADLAHWETPPPLVGG